MVYVQTQENVIHLHNVLSMLEQVGGATKKMIPKQARVYKSVIQMRTLEIMKESVYGIKAISQIENNVIVIEIMIVKVTIV